VKYLLDTNICIHIIRRQPPTTVQRIRSEEPESIAVSTITLAELEYGVAKSQYPDRNRLALLEFLVPFTIVDFDQGAATHYGSIRAAVEAKGNPIGAMDMLIAAQARSRGLVLVTNNMREFRRVEGLQVENWVTG
jgi:tRNA(fMet)-specific endonuclease VapC